MKISVIIPSWNGEKLLRKNLPAVLAFLPTNTEVIFVDDGSEDGSREYLRKSKVKSQKSKVKLIENKDEVSEYLGGLESSKLEIKTLFNKENRGFIYSVNRGMGEARGELAVLLNNDVVPEKGFLEAVLKHFKDPAVFAVSFNEQQYGWAKIFWQNGFIQHGVGDRPKKSHISAWASGGSAVYRKSIWRRLGGFDPLYHPFYWEDFDLGYRAWKAGYKIIWEPKAVVEHRHESTISKLDQSHVALIKERNQLLFIWKNIDDRWYRLGNFLGILGRIAKGPGYLKVVWMALGRYKKFGWPRGGEKKRTDKEVLRLFK